MARETAHENDDTKRARGRHAQSPIEIPARGWKEVLWRVWGETNEDNISIIAAGCAFFALLALFPGITALVSIYGLVADPVAVERQLGLVQGVLPGAAFEIIAGQAHKVASGGSTALSWGAVLSILLALYSVTSGVKTLFTALNVAYEQPEERSFIRFNATALLFTLAAIIGIPIVLTIIIGVPAALNFLPVSPVTEWGIRGISWLLLLLLVVSGLGLLYRFGPSRQPANWRWLTPGSIVATVLWLIASLLFSYYAANFASYNETYGTLGGVIVLLMWLYVSAFVVLLGGELNAELELQTERDTTTGPERPRGERGAFVADNTPESRNRREQASERAAEAVDNTTQQPGRPARR